MTNLEARHADDGWFGFLQQHGYVAKVLRTHAMAVLERGFMCGGCLGGKRK